MAFPPHLFASPSCAQSRRTTCISDISFDKAPVMVGDQEGGVAPGSTPWQGCRIAEAVRRRERVAQTGDSRSQYAAVVGSPLMGGAGWRDLLIEEDRYGFKLAVGSGAGHRPHLPSPDSSRVTG
jgi:hypothetical protein